MDILDESSDNSLVDDRSNVRDDSNYDFLTSPTEDPLGYFDKSSSPSGWAGGTTADNFANIADGIESGDWVAVGLAGAGIGLDAVGAITDPIGFVAGQLFSWMLEHIEPLRATMHALAGNPGMIKGYASTWDNIEKTMKSVGSDYADSSVRETSGWPSEAGKAYRAEAAEFAEVCKSSAEAARGLATASYKMAEVVGAVRSLVRDLLAGLAGAMVSYALELAGTLGAAAPLVIEQALTRIATTGGKIARTIAKLVQTISALGDLLGPLKTALEGLNKTAQAHQKNK
ncbi:MULTISPECIES: hypothetical protein [unclassified Actinopolyspora]|uniref:WXG100-like domain-containing protein n=1 Tax=Actinopolyspora TaxID=1849 RepID=UPI0013F61422|nr:MULTISPECIES: hypothetical protein [unclassified Actinopolyspora]NHD18904.1 hypothetical protein [Actinopolyspora sp. BKK2]NHE77327.1 hypothetical protein [Actinopolyspora sp. BKK1]